MSEEKEKIVTAPEPIEVPGTIEYTIVFQPDGTYEVHFKCNNEGHLAAMTIVNRICKGVVVGDSKQQDKTKKLSRKKRECFANTIYITDSFMSDLSIPMREIYEAEYKRLQIKAASKIQVVGKGAMLPEKPQKKVKLRKA